MLSGRGIDGELKSKFGEWSEKFWKSSSGESPSEAKNFQAIYFTSKGGSGGDEGKSLSEMRGSNGKNLILTGNEDKVQSLFSVCVGGQNGNGNGCKENKNNASVVLVGGDGWNESILKREFSSKWDSNNSWRLIESGKNYDNVFRGFARNDKNSSKRETDGQLNGTKLSRLKTVSKVDQSVMNSLCEWVKNQNGFVSDNSGYNDCLGGKQIGLNKEKLTLTGFLESEWAGSYFSDKFWEKYNDAGPYFALLTLINLFSNSLANIEYEKSWPEINGENRKILKSLFEQNSKFVYLSSSKNNSNLESVTLHSDGAWDLTFCKENGCDNENALKISVSRNQFCISGKVCFDKNSNPARLRGLGSQWNNLHNSGTALWTKIIGNQNYDEVWRNFLLGLINACFGEEEKVSLSINADVEKGKMLLKKLN